MVRLRAHRNGSLRGLYGSTRHKTKTACTHAINRFFSGRKFGLYQHSLAALEHASIYSPSICSPHGSANGYASMETYLLFALYLLQSIGSLEQFETRPRLSYERACQDRGRSFCFCFLLLFSHCTKLEHDHNSTTVHDLNLQQ